MCYSCSGFIREGVKSRKHKITRTLILTGIIYVEQETSC